MTPEQIQEKMLEEIQANPVWPFEPGYQEMSPAEQLESRLRVMTAWHDPDDSSTLIADRWAFLRGVILFLNYHIKGWSENKSWYHLQTPFMHYRWLYEITYPLTAIAAYRSSGKSTLIGKVVPMFIALTRRQTKVGLVLINHSMGKERGREIQKQLEENPLILADFGLQKGRRGGRTWNTNFLELPSGSVIKVGTVKSAMRGGRPDWFILDDPEKDAEMRNPELLHQFRQDLFRVMLPTLDPGKAFTWIGTLINVRALLYTVVLGNDTQFKNWNKVDIQLIQTDANGKEYSTWTEKFSVEDSKLMQGVGSEDGRVKGIGRAAFFAEYQNRPIPDDEYSFAFDPMRHTYQIVPDGNRMMVVYQDKVVEYGEWIKGMMVAVCMDPAYTQGPDSDYTCIMATGLDREGCLWVLEYAMERMSSTRAIQELFRLCTKYDAALIGCEANGLQSLYYSSIEEQLYAWLASGSSRTIPKIEPIRTPNTMSKGTRIQALDWRFAADKIRLRRPAFQGDVSTEELEYQVVFFTPSLTGLKHDDAVDCLEMSQRLLTGRGRPGVEKTPEVESMEEVLKDLGIQTRYLDASRIPVSVVLERARKKQDQKTDASNGKFDLSLI